MKLVYKNSGKEVKVGDKVTLRDGNKAEIAYFRPPHKPSSEGKITVKEEGDDGCREYYVGVVGAEWIDREDRR